MQLTPNAVRILGSLVEKELTVPDTYPLTINSLVTAANQSTNRFPVMSLTAVDVQQAINELKSEYRLVRMLPSGAGNRVDKYRHVLEDRFGLSRPEKAVLAILALRGPQTIAELRARTNRMHDFADNDGLEQVIDRLADPTLQPDLNEPTDAKQSGMLHMASSSGAVLARPEGYVRDWPSALVVRLDRQPGQHEPRVMHLLGGPIDAASVAVESAGLSRGAGAGSGNAELVERIDALEALVSHLQADFEALRRELGA
jgi:uncharacterized protein